MSHDREISRREEMRDILTHKANKSQTLMVPTRWRIHCISYYIFPFLLPIEPLIRSILPWCWEWDSQCWLKALHPMDQQRRCSFSFPSFSVHPFCVCSCRCGSVWHSKALWLNITFTVCLLTICDFVILDMNYFCFRQKSILYLFKRSAATWNL